MGVHKVELKIGNRTLQFETGKLAKQADGAVVIRYGDSVVMATACSATKAKEGIDFLPLVVDFQARTYAAGKIPGGFFKREGRLGEKEILTCRLIDRPLRPLFPKNYFFDTQIIATILSADKGNCTDLLGLNASSCALTISNIPFAGPVGAVRVGRIEGEFFINPNHEEVEHSDINLIVAGTKDAVLMVEGGANEVAEGDMLNAIYCAHEVIKEICEKQEELARLVGNEKREFTPEAAPEDLVESVTSFSTAKIVEALKVSVKAERKALFSTVEKEAVESLGSTENSKTNKQVQAIVHSIIKNEMRQSVIKTGKRIDGRSSTDIRTITGETSLLPMTHGSAVFTRGETQSLSVVTLGTTDDAQRLDTIDGESSKSFMLHYNFPPFSVGEVRMMRGPSRREIGHGALAERALTGVLPDQEDFPYTIRLVSEILESNGSSSMATICAGSMAMMDAGVPIKSPVSGIAMGLIKEGDDFVILSDILGDEDHLGDMDFKVAGTPEGITALQMDMKIQGISKEILLNALIQAKAGREHILGKIKETIASPREELSQNAPRIVSLQVKQEKIRDIIGPGGKVIKDIVARTGVKIDIDDDGVVNIFSSDSEAAAEAIEIIKEITEFREVEPDVGKIYNGTVVKTTNFGAFVEIMKHVTGLLHISELANRRVNRVEDVVVEGDKVNVKVLAVDERGKIKLSRKAALEEGEE